MTTRPTVYTIAAELHAMLGDTVDDFEFTDLVDRVTAVRGVL